MIARALHGLLAVGLLLASAPSTIAQAPPPAPEAAAPVAPPPGSETFEVGLSTDVISVGTNFAGAQLVVFGALDNADARVQRQGRYDIAVLLEGPRRPLVVRERDRFLGIWINQGAQRFADVPTSYTLSSTRPLRDIAPREALRQLSLGAANQPFLPTAAEAANRPGQAAYGEALLRLKAESGLYLETSGTVEFVSSTLFRATLTLPADLPVGRHVMRAYLFKEGQFMRSRTEDLRVVKTGFESQLSTYAARNGLVYGLVAVLLAFLVGWLGRVLFKRD